ncbi:HlyD family secretion protein (plasmid) [Kovacikia minuta CCNUW1]|uniref:HlyD family secretion protein n=1 Tax=Kovacikia minuta TaxID=2931930 RepID=UPI001CCF2BA9|nr:HlyD family secretion protein [Kovacikia minuta]UBF30397.1 HlyD family secretion protein [Kovacikia minuta CCNUW1]
MKPPQIQSHPTEPDSIDIQTLTSLEKSEHQKYQNNQPNDRLNQHQNQSFSNQDSEETKQSVELEELEQDSHPHRHASNGSTATDDEAVESDMENGEEIGEQSKAGNKKRRGALLIIGAIVLAIGSIFGLRWWQFQSTHVSTDNAQIKGHLSPISAKVPATIKQVLVNDGDYVKAGQTLVVLEDQDLNLKVQQAEANLAAAQAALRSARDTVSVTSQTNPTQVQQAQSSLAARASAVRAAQASVNQAQAKVETNQANAEQAQTAVDKTQADLRRYQLLYKEGAIPAQQLDTAQAAYKDAQAGLVAANKTVAQAEADVKNAQAQLQSAQAEVAAAQGQVAEKQVSGQTVTVQKDQQQQAQAQVKQAQVELQLAHQQIAYTVVKAPISGYVGQITAQVGQKVAAEQPFLSIVPLQTDEVYVDANFKETTLGKLQIGEKAEVEVDAYPGETFQATIAGMSPATGASFALIPPDNATGNFNKVVQWVPIRLAFDPNTDPQHKLRPGLSVKVTVDTTTGAQSASAQTTH